jgi:glucose-1-phosphate thymidylyltransferase
MKGIILAGGSGSRLAPLTSGFSKQLLPIYDKPMIYYPLSVMMLAGIRDILIITTPSDLPFFKKILGDGESFGMQLDFISQDSPDGIAQAFILGENFIGNDNVSLILGDNIFFGYGFSKMLLEASNLKVGARIFTTYVQDPRAYAVAEFDETGSVLSLEEKPQLPKSNYAVTGLYFYDNSVIEISKNLKPSARGELEITDVNIEYLKMGTLKSSQLGRGFAWLDTGTHESLLDAGEFVSTIEKRQGLKIACLEEIAFNNGWIDHSALLKQAQKFHNSPYGQYLKALID